MFKLTRKTEYALLALGYLKGSPDDSVTKVREIADRHRIPFPILAKVMQQLARHSYVEPLQGPRGGYRLGERAITGNLWMFLERMEGPQGLMDCIISTDCAQISTCTIQSPLRGLDATIRNFFNNLQLQDVLVDMSANPAFGAPPSAARVPD